MRTQNKESGFRSQSVTDARGAKSECLRRKGASTIEMTLVGIPIIFVMISVFEISRGMWMYETAAHAVREGVRFAVVHGANCVNDPANGFNNNCAKTAAEVAAKIREAGVGLDPATTMVRFTAAGVALAQCPLNACPATLWPPAGQNTVGTVIQIDISTPFNSALAMFWPGAGAVSFTTTNMGASSSDAIQF